MKNCNQCKKSHFNSSKFFKTDNIYSVTQLNIKSYHNNVVIFNQTINQLLKKLLYIEYEYQF